MALAALDWRFARRAARATVFVDRSTHKKRLILQQPPVQSHI